MNQLDGIDVFVAVIEQGSFSKAAKVLAMPVTTVSTKISSLESRLGITLIHRTTRKLSITQAGSDYFNYCKQALLQMELAHESILKVKSSPEGVLRITAPPDLGHTVLPAIVRQYLKEYPATQIELILTNRMVDLVGEGVDLALRAGVLKDSSLMVRQLQLAKIKMWAAPKYIKKYGRPKGPEELQNHALLCHKRLGSELLFKRNKTTLSLKLSPRLQVNDMESCKLFTMAADGIGFFTQMICEEEIKAGKLIEILPDWNLSGELSESPISFVYPAGRYLSPNVRAFLDLAFKNFNI